MLEYAIHLVGTITITQDDVRDMFSDAFTGGRVEYVEKAARDKIENPFPRTITDTLIEKSLHKYFSKPALAHDLRAIYILASAQKYTFRLTTNFGTLIYLNADDEICLSCYSIPMPKDFSIIFDWDNEIKPNWYGKIVIECDPADAALLQLAKN